MMEFATMKKKQNMAVPVIARSYDTSYSNSAAFIPFV